MVVFSLALFASVTSIVVSHSFAQGTAISDVQSQLGYSNASSSTDIVSLVENVTVTKFDILSPRQLSVELRYSGTGNAPAVKVDVSAINIDSKLADDITNELNILNASSGDSNSNQSLTKGSTNVTSLMLDRLDQLTSSFSESNGTKTVGADWKSPRNVQVKWQETRHFMTQILSAFSSINDSAFNYVESTAVVVVLAASGAGLLLEKLD